MDEIKKQVLEEILIEMDPRIVYSLNETPMQEREDLKQEIYRRLLEAIDKMEVVDLDTFVERKSYERESNED
ncbi:hypothetical protein ABC345_20725 [Shouchella sp. 1P09AA]|uniref:hypothetical protein n=1 Tax=unclassified Shouchella TaxID=2893065 RepID=UPI0039A1085D